MQMTMRDLIVTMLIGLTLFTGSFAFAKEEEQTIEVSGFAFAYDEVLLADTNNNGTNDRSSYYKGGKLILSAYDENEDGKDDLWFEWKDDKVVLEMRSGDNGGTPDEFLVVDEREKTLAIETPKGGGSGGLFDWLLIFALIGAAAWWYNKKHSTKTP